MLHVTGKTISVDVLLDAVNIYDCNMNMQNS